MRYYGGKNRLGKEISILLKIISDEYDINDYMEPFCGSLGVLINMTDDYKCYASDYNKDLILLWKSIKNNTFKPPRNISKNTYDNYKISKKHSWIRGFIGIAYSYSGGWFNGYCPSIGNRNYVDETIRSLISMQPKIKKVIFKHICYSKLNPNGMLIYCDPPYVDKNQKYSKNDFDTKIFWDIMRKWSINNIVVISETTSPKDFKCIWKKEYSTGVNSKGSKRVEKIFMHKPLYDLLQIKNLSKNYKHHNN